MSAKVTVSAAVALMLTGCAFEPALTAKIVDYNRVFEDASNSVLLLNILRAKDRKPLHFSVVQAFTPTLSGTGELSLNIPLNPTAYTSLGITTRASATTQNQATIAAENAKKFMQGLTRPIPIEVIDHYWQQRWPPELLWTLFIGKVEIVPVDKNGDDVKNPRDQQKDALVCVVANSAFRTKPSNPQSSTWAVATEFRKFCNGLEFPALVRDFRKHLRFARQTVNIGPELSRSEVANLKTLADLSKDGFVVAAGKTPGRFQLQRASQATAFCWDDEPGFGRATARDQYLSEDIRRSSYFPCSKPVNVAGHAERAPIGGSTDTCPSLNGLNVVSERARCRYIIHLRSVEGIIYFLGSILRAQELNQPPRSINTRVQLSNEAEGRSSLLFTLHRGKGGGRLSVTYDGVSYSAEQDGSNTIHVLSFLTQLLALNREADELPRAVFVNVTSP